MMKSLALALLPFFLNFRSSWGNKLYFSAESIVRKNLLVTVVLAISPNEVLSLWLLLISNVLLLTLQESNES